MKRFFKKNISNWQNADKKVYFRFLFSFLILLSVLYGPFLLAFFLALLGMIFFKKYYEAPFLLLVSDLLYGVTENKFLGMIIISFVTFSALLLAIEFLKRKMKFN